MAITMRVASYETMRTRGIVSSLKAEWRYNFTVVRQVWLSEWVLIGAEAVLP